MSGGETSWSKISGAKHQGPKCKVAKRPGPKRLSAKTLPEPSLHDCETSSMILTLDEASL